MVGVGTARNFSYLLLLQTLPRFVLPNVLALRLWEKGSDSSCWDFFSTGVVLLLNLEAGY